MFAREFPSSYSSDGSDSDPRFVSSPFDLTSSTAKEADLSSFHPLFTGAESIIISATKVPFRMQACLENLVGCLGESSQIFCSTRLQTDSFLSFTFRWNLRTDLLSTDYSSRMLTRRGRGSEIQPRSQVGNTHRSPRLDDQDRGRGKDS